MNEMTEHRVRIIRPGEPEERAVVRLPEQASARYYSALRSAVEAVTGGPMEHVRVYCDFDGGTNFHYTDMFCHETGHLLGMPRNETATALYRSNVMQHEMPPPHPEDLPHIVGAVVLFEKKVWF